MTKVVSESTRRERRAARLRAKTLSPSRIVLSIISVPLVAGSVALSVYIRTSPYEPSQAVAHLVARAGCDAAAKVGLAPSYRDGLGYHARNDADNDGVACEIDGISPGPLQDAANTPTVGQQNPSQRMVGGAKFIKP